MVSEKEPKRVTRRQFLKGAAALGASALLSSCGIEEKSPQTSAKTPSPQETIPPAKSPTKEPSPSAEPTFTPEPAPAREIINIPGLALTEEYLQNAFAGIGGEETVANGEEEVSLVNFGQDYVSASWGEKIDFESLPQSPIGSLKYLISLGAYRGEEGVFAPGRKGEEVVFPQLAELSLARITLEKVPSFSQEEEQEGAEWVSPRGLTLRPDTQMTVVGLLAEPKVDEGASVGQEALSEQPDYALVAFTDYLRADEETKVPRHYLAVVPTHFPADPDNQNALTLANLLKANGYEYSPKDNQISLVDSKTGKQILLELNKIEGEELISQLREATGLYFVDQLNNELIKNPIVPYPEEMPQVWDISPQKDENGDFFLLLSSQNEKGEIAPYAKASYNLEKEEWGWEKLISSEQQFVLTPEEEQQLKADIFKIYEPYGGENSEVAQDILRNLEEAKKLDPNKFPENMDQYEHYRIIVGWLAGVYYASGDSPENRNQKILEVLAQIRELARPNPFFNEKDWEVEK